MAHANPVELRPDQVISATDFKKRIKNEDMYVIDVRNPPEIEEQGFINSKRRVNIPIAELDEALSLSLEAFKTKYNIDKPTGDGSDVVFHCFMGRRGAMGVNKAEKTGLKKAQNLEGGFKSWKASNCQQ